MEQVYLTVTGYPSPLDELLWYINVDTGNMAL